MESARTWSPTREARLRRSACHGQHTSVGIDIGTRETPSLRCSKRALDLALEFVADRNTGARFEQPALQRYLFETGEYKEGTAQGYASGALLFLREEGFVRRISGGPGEGIQTWEVL